MDRQTDRQAQLPTTKLHCGIAEPESNKKTRDGQKCIYRVLSSEYCAINSVIKHLKIRVIHLSAIVHEA